MRDKVKETVLRDLRSDAKLNTEERTWVAERIKYYDAFAAQATDLENKWSLLQKKLAAIELTYICDGSERSQGYIAAIRDIQKFVNEL